ncbi:hypothetical protein EJB05_52288, partial [Eragrostis curvula]
MAGRARGPIWGFGRGGGAGLGPPRGGPRRGRGGGRDPRQKNVQVSLRAKWPGPRCCSKPEWKKELFWDFIDNWKELDKGSDCLTAKCCIQKIVEDARALLNEPLSTIFEFSTYSSISIAKISAFTGSLLKSHYLRFLLILWSKFLVMVLKKNFHEAGKSQPFWRNLLLGRHRECSIVQLS